MSKRHAVRLVATLVVAVGALATTSAAAAEEAPPSIVVADGVTQPVFGYADAIRQRVWVDATFDSDLDGVNDRIAMDIIRPKASDEGLKVPVIMDASPYYTTLGRGNESELIADTDGDGLNDRWPLFYDNYFVPRGYAVVLLHMVGTGFSDGCPVTGGTPDNLSGKVGVDWLNGRAVAHDAAGNEVTADWTSGKVGMIGKSYDGTLANAVASTGVEGLETIVPISAISSWYFYTRSNGIRFNTNYPSSLSNTVTNAARRAHCAAIRSILNATDGDETGDYTDFWAERDYVKDARNVKASVFVVHGLQDDNVKPNNFSVWWDALPEDVVKKIWLARLGHVDPFDFRRAEWVSTLHEWFDHELWGVKNDILKEPQADVEYAADEWKTYSRWPVPQSHAAPIRLAETTADAAGTLRLGPAPGSAAPVLQSFTDTPSQSETTAISNPQNVTANRRVFLTPPLAAPLHLSGTPVVRLRASANDVDTNLGAIVVDYGAATQVSRTGDGAITLATEDCWGESSPADDPCYRQVGTRTTDVTQWRVSRGILDALNRHSLTEAEELVPGVFDEFDFELMPQDYVFQAGHQLGLVIVGSYPSYSSVADQNRATITLDLTRSTIELPVVGGVQTLKAAGLLTVTPAGVKP